MLRHAVKISAFSITLILVVVWLVTASQSFHDCVHTNKNQKPYSDLHANPSVNGRAALRLRLNVVCVGGSINKEQGALTLLATALIAWFTFSLRQSTEKLRQAGERQNEIARRMATIAGQQTAIARRQTDIIRGQHDIDRLRFLASHQPNIQTISFEASEVSEGSDGASKLGVSLRYVNAGNAEAHLLEIGWHISFAERPLRPGHTMKTHACGDQLLQPGEVSGYPLEPEIPVTRYTVASAEIRNDRDGRNEKLRCVGYVLYADRAGRQHRTGFSRIYVPAGNRWDREANPDYQYSY